MPPLACSSVGQESSAAWRQHLYWLLQDGNRCDRWGTSLLEAPVRGGGGGISVFKQIDLFYIQTLICFICRHFSSK